MNIAKKLNENFYQKREELFNYIDNIKKNIKISFFNVINITMILNPYNTEFPKRFFLKEYSKENKFILFLMSTLKFYIKNFAVFFMYFVGYIIYKMFYKKSLPKCEMAIDIFFLIDKILKEEEFKETHYFPGLYDVLREKKINYCFIVRFYDIFNRKFSIKKLVSFFKILNSSNEKFIFEYSLMSFFDFVKLFFLMLLYPFKTLKLIQEENNIENKIFNQNLLIDIKNQQFNAFTRYIFGKNIVKYNNILNIKRIYSWSEFQVIERSFNYAVKQNSQIKLIAAQLYLNYNSYFNSFIRDIDYDLGYAPEEVLVNSKYYMLNTKKVKYKIGVSFRYNKVFNFKKEKDEKIIVLGSYIINDTKNMLEMLKDFKDIVFKNHPLIDLNVYKDLLKNMIITNENVYELFKGAKLVFGMSSGTLLEAVACGLSVIVIANKDNFTANPLVEYGKGKIWDIVYTKDDINSVYNKLIEFRKNKEEIDKIAKWYKDNFFIKPNKENIIKNFIGER